MSLEVWEYVVIKQPKKDKDGTVIDPGGIVVPITSLLAKDQEQAQMIAARAIPEEAMVDIDRLTVGLRPFDIDQGDVLEYTEPLKGLGPYQASFANPRWLTTSGTGNATYSSAGSILSQTLSNTSGGS